MSLRGTVKQHIFDITNNMSLESCKKLRGLLQLLSDSNLQEEVISNLLRQVSSGTGRGKLLSEIVLFLTEMTIFHHIHKSNPDIVDNIAAVFYAVTTNDSINVLVRILAYSSLSEISSFVKKVDYLHMYSACPSAEFLIKYHNGLLVAGAVTSQQQDHVITKLTANRNITPCLMRRCLITLPPDKLPQVRNITDLSDRPPQFVLLHPALFAREHVLQACAAVLSVSNTRTHFQRLAFHILLQERQFRPAVVAHQIFDSYETRALKIIMMSYHPECEESGQLMAALLNLHKHFFYKIGGEYPSLFFRVVWKVYHNSKKEQTLREIEQTVKIMLFDQPKYSLYAVNFLNSIPFSLYSPTLLEVLLQLVEFTTNQPLDTFRAASEHYLSIFKHYLTLNLYSPTPIILYCTKLAGTDELTPDQITTLTEMITTILHHPRLSSITPELAVLCTTLSRFPLHQSYMLFLYRYLTTYSTSKLQTSLFGASKYSSQLSEHGGLCTYLERPMLKLDRIASTISRNKYTVPSVAYTAFDMPLYLSSLHLSIALSYCIHLARDEEYLTCVEFQLRPNSEKYHGIESVFVPVLRSGDMITVKLETEHPVTASIGAEVEYTQHSHHYRSALPPLQVDISDLLCPLPLSNFTPALVFKQLWDYCEQHQRSGGAGDAIVSKMRPADGFKLKLSAFRLPDVSGERSVSYMFGLPPQHYVLVSCVPEFAAMKIAADSWHIFPVVHRLLTAPIE